MFSIPKYNSPVSLIPGGCQQFLDFEHNIGSLKGIRYFLEKNNATQPEKKILHCLKEDANGNIVHEESGEIVNAAYQEIPLKKAIDPWLGQWLPVPFLRKRDQRWDDDGGTRFECGPSNWARIRLARDHAIPDLLRVVLVFDMKIETPPQDSEVYFALSPNDVEAHGEFQLAANARDNSWFLNLNWVDEWLRIAWGEFQKKGKKRQESDFSLEYLASYLTMLTILKEAIRDVTVQTIKPSGVPIDVDLVLDIGNSRTTGILVETRTQRSTNLNDSYLLQLRDLSRPENVYVEPFETRIEFSEAQFGEDRLSRQSGRRTAAFTWPSPVRIGPEAARLSTLALCAEGLTGMSSPKRYLWDERNWAAGWRYNTLGEREPRVTKGPLPREVNSSGTPLCCMDSKLFLANQKLRSQERESALAANFSRSSLMMFMLVEVLQQALMTINSPGKRCLRELPNVPRRLRQIIFTVPSGMPIAEQRIYRRWVTWAVRVLWKILEWDQYYIEDHKRAAPGDDYRWSPKIRCNWDEATCTQLVYIYNETIKKYGDTRTLCEIMGTPRPEYGNRPAMRIATIDIGGGTTDLSIATFVLENESHASSRMRPHLELRDGFNIAGDHILRDVIKFILLPEISAAMTACGTKNSEQLLSRLFGRDLMDSSQETHNRRGQCARQLLMPAALCILTAYEKNSQLEGEGTLTCVLRDFFEPALLASVEATEQSEAPPLTQPEWPFSPKPAPSAAVIAYIESACRESLGNSAFSLMDTPLRIQPRKIDAVVKETMSGVLANLCEVIQLYDCDMLLLTGRPSRWKGIVSSIFAKLPVPPDRIMPMSEYRVDAWYPFADTSGVITDPKTTVVVGAILCSLAEGHLEGFSFDSSSLVPSSTARFIGEMDRSGQIKKDKVWFEVDVTSKKNIQKFYNVTMAGPIAVGFRLLDVERWTTTRFYLIDFANENARRASSGNLPLTIKLSFELQEVEEDENGRVPEGEERDEGGFMIEEITDSLGNTVKNKDIEIRLQTLPLDEDEGVWLDTGIIH